MNEFNFFNDGGHGWIEVPIEVLRAMGINDKISSYSYQKDTMAYLEEDCDGSLFFETYIKINNEKPKFNDIYEQRSRVRSYQAYIG